MVDSAYSAGYEAEQKARLFLEEQGFHFLHHRYRTPYGEIDLLMLHDTVIVAIEVKLRKFINDSHYAVTPKQQQRIHDALMYYVQENNIISPFLRCDVVLLSRHQHIIHYKNAF